MASAHMVCKVFFLFMLRSENLEKGNGLRAHGVQSLLPLHAARREPREGPWVMRTWCAKSSSSSRCSARTSRRAMASAHMVCKVFFFDMLRGKNLEKGCGFCAHGVQSLLHFHTARREHREGQWLMRTRRATSAESMVSTTRPRSSPASAWCRRSMSSAPVGKQREDEEDQCRGHPARGGITTPS